MMAKDDMTSRALLGKVKRFSASFVWALLNGDKEKVERWGSRLDCAKWCAEQRGIDEDTVGWYMRAGAKMAYDFRDKRRCWHD